jgi:hypothetical protein
VTIVIKTCPITWYNSKIRDKKQTEKNESKQDANKGIKIKETEKYDKEEQDKRAGRT